MAEDGPASPAQWLRVFIEGTYLIDNCECGIRRACKNFFCHRCTEDYVCGKQFVANGTHEGHERIQVRKSSSRFIVEVADLAVFTDTKLLQKCMVNNKVACYLQSRPGGPVSKDKSKYRSCSACGDFLCHSDAGNGPYCSIECLLKLNRTPMLENLASVAASDQIGKGRNQTMHQTIVVGNPLGATHEARMELPPRTVEEIDPRPTMDFARLISRFLNSC